MNVTIYVGFNKNQGDYPLLAILNGIGGGRWSPTVNAIRRALLEGDSEKADRLKKSLPAFTLSATYDGSRRKDSITGYRGLIILDIDKLDADQIDPLRWKTIDCAYTVFCFRSPSFNGLKIGVDPLAVVGNPLITHALTLENHRATFLACAAYYQELLGVTIDPSGKDPGRLCFVSFDPDLYVNTEVLHLAAERRPAATVRGATGETAPAAQPAPPESAAAASVYTRIDTLKRIRSRITRKMGPYAEGNRNNYVFRFACMCAKEKVPRDEALAFCGDRFRDLTDTELSMTVESAYRTVEETVASHPASAEKEGRKEKLLADAEDWLRRNYHLRFNVITRLVEYRHLQAGKNCQPLDDQAENSIWRAMQHDGIAIRLNVLHTLLMSDFCIPFDPFRGYFGSLPPWDGTTDHIRRLAETVETDKPQLWYCALRRFLVAMVASALDKEVVNHTVLVLASEQGKGKTTWCLNLIPPELHGYRYSGIPDPRSKDAMDTLSKNLLINLDELGTLSMKELNPLKEMITKNVIHYRPAYARNMEHHTRIASFTGSVNSTQVFADMTGSRRFACFEARRIDYLTPVDYAGVYSQVMALYRQGFRFWLDDAEIEEMNINNETFRIRTPEEEIFYTWVRKPTEADTAHVEYLTSAQILAVLCHKVPLSMSHNALIRIGMILKKDAFRYFTRHKKRLYAVVIRTSDEVNTEKSQDETSPSKKDLDVDNEQYMFR